MKFKTVLIAFFTIFFWVSLSLIFVSSVPSLAQSVKSDTASQSLYDSNESQKNLISSRTNSINSALLETKNNDKDSAGRLEGVWYNELGSTMTINKVRQGGFTGSYQTAVSESGCAKGAFSLVGRTDVDNGGQNVAFVVSFRNDISDCKSASGWSGQLQNINGEAQITTTALLTRATEPSNDWQSTIVGQDLFKRSPYATQNR